jgi:hypothetical protein
MVLERDPMRSAGTRLSRAVTLAVVAIALGPIASTMAAPPNVTITSPATGSASNNPTPSFAGRAEEGGTAVTLRMYDGPTAEGPVVQELSTALIGFGGAWSLGPTEVLNDGIYTARASQTNVALQTGTSAPVTFTVDTASPRVTLNSIESPVSDTTPSFNGTASDTSPVKVDIHAGATAKGTVVSTATAAGTGAGWISANASPALSNGQYTAVATQVSSLGNPAGRSGPVTFTVAPSPAASPPAVLGPATPVGLSSLAPAAIRVVAHRAALMQPFPVVRIAGAETASGVKLRLLKVQQLPAGALVTVRCKGHGCPLKTAKWVAVLRKGGVGPFEFRRFERFLPFASILEIFVTKPGEIGKYTRFAVRRRKLPVREDTCLDPTGAKPLACPY